MGRTKTGKKVYITRVPGRGHLKDVTLEVESRSKIPLVLILYLCDDPTVLSRLSG